MEELFMDVKEQINKVVEEVKSNPNIKEQFEKEPVKVIENVVGVDLPDDVVTKIVDGVKAKISLGGISGAADKIKGLFNK